MLSDFYLPSPLPPLPFHNQEDDFSDLVCHPPSSQTRLPLFAATDETNRRDLACFSLFVAEEREAEATAITAADQQGLGEEEGVTASPAHLFLAPEQPYYPSYAGGGAAESTGSTTETTSPAAAAAAAAENAEWHPSCPGCMAAYSHPTSTTGSQYTLSLAEAAGAYDSTTVGPFSGAAHSPGDTTDGGMSLTSTTNYLDQHTASGTPSLFSSWPGSSSSPYCSPNSPLHSWEGNGFYGPVPRREPLSTSPRQVTPANSAAAEQHISFARDDSCDGGVYTSGSTSSGWPSSVSSPFVSGLGGDPSVGLYAYPSTISSCADMSPGSMLLGSPAPLTYGPYTPSSAGSSWFASTPSVAGFMPSSILLQSTPSSAAMIPLAAGTVAVLPVDAKSSDVSQKRKRAPQPNPGRPGSPHICTECGVDKTPEWRRGPCGPRTLCNACGLRYAKRNKKKKEEENAANGQQPPSTASPPQPGRKPRSTTASPIPGGRRSPSPPPAGMSTSMAVNPAPMNNKTVAFSRGSSPTTAGGSATPSPLQ